MKLPVSLQLTQAVVSLLCGAAAGLMCDISAGIKSAFSSKLLHVAEDIFFCAFIGILLFLLGFIVGEGRLRLFMTVFFFIGFSLHFLLLSHLLRPHFKAFFSRISLPVKAINYYRAL